MYLVGDGNSKIRKLGQLQLGSSLSQGKGGGAEVWGFSSLNLRSLYSLLVWLGVFDFKRAQEWCLLLTML